jgi:hypothetical protein
MHCAGTIQNRVILKQVVPEVFQANTQFYLSIIHLSGMKTSLAIETLLTIYNGDCFTICRLAAAFYGSKNWNKAN